MFYIEKNDKLNLLAKILNIIELDDNVLKLPIVDEKEYGEKEMRRLAKRTYKIISNNSNSKKIVLSKDIYSLDILINYLNSYGLEISDGRWLFRILIPEVVYYLLEKNLIGSSINDLRLSFLINDLSDMEIENIKILSKKIKSINIVTNHVEKFRRIVKELSDKEGIIIPIINNKRKSLVKSDIIINIDFPSELINKYNISDDAVIINARGKIKINKKRFNGLVIYDYDLDYRYDKKEEQSLNDKYYLKDIYESEIYKKQPIKEIRTILKKDKVVINKLVFLNGEI